jgi:hypothetical protein
MTEQKFPTGWDAERVQKLIAQMDARTDEEWVAGDEAAVADGPEQTVMAIPTALVPAVRQLIAAHAAG